MADRQTEGWTDFETMIITFSYWLQAPRRASN